MLLIVRFMVCAGVLLIVRFIVCDDGVLLIVRLRRNKLVVSAADADADDNAAAATTAGFHRKYFWASVTMRSAIYTGNNRGHP